MCLFIAAIFYPLGVIQRCFSAVIFRSGKTFRHKHSLSASIQHLKDTTGVKVPEILISKHICAVGHCGLENF